MGVASLFDTWSLKSVGEGLATMGGRGKTDDLGLSAADKTGIESSCEYNSGDVYSNLTRSYCLEIYD